jgi:hypothetical protein
MVVAFRRHQSPYTGFTCVLREIDADANYDVAVSPGYTTTPSKTMKGAGLRAVVLNIDEAPDSVLLEYRPLPKQQSVVPEDSYLLTLREF